MYFFFDWIAWIAYFSLYFVAFSRILIGSKMIGQSKINYLLEAEVCNKKDWLIGTCNIIGGVVLVVFLFFCMAWYFSYLESIHGKPFRLDDNNFFTLSSPESFNEPIIDSGDFENRHESSMPRAQPKLIL